MVDPPAAAVGSDWRRPLLPRGPNTRLVQRVGNSLRRHRFKSLVQFSTTVIGARLVASVSTLIRKRDPSRVTS